MATDATALLIKRISTEAKGGVADSTADILVQVDDLVDAAASYAQILGTAAAPVAAIGAETGGVAAAAVIFVSFILAALTSRPGSTETMQLNEINNGVQNSVDQGQASYWENKISQVMSFWNSPTGGLGTDLDNLANEGTGGVDVKNDVTKFHDHAIAFLNNLVGSPGSQIYWERPVDQSQIFSSQTVVYSYPGLTLAGYGYFPGQVKGKIMAWYGNPQPRPQATTPLGGSAQQMALDPRSMLPYLLLGIKSYLTIEALLNVIDRSQPTFKDFLSQFRGDLQSYADFIHSQYLLAANGIVKSDQPSKDDIVAFFWFTLFVVNQWSYINATGSSGSAPMRKEPETESYAYRGFAWNGVYGAVDQYPPYGAYQPSPPVPAPSATPSYIIDIIQTDKLVTDLQLGDGGDFMYGPYQSAILTNNIVPWVEGKLILGRMARWKAVYLNNGYDKVWSILQNLRVLAGQSPLAVPKLDQDGTLVSGNWSARELCTILNVNGQFLDRNSEFGEGYSLCALTQWLSANALANWTGTANVPFDAQTTTGSTKGRPLSFRGQLAAAAV